MHALLHRRQFLGFASDRTEAAKSHSHAGRRLAAQPDRNGQSRSRLRRAPDIGTPHRALFESIWGPRAFAITWLDNVDALCSLPNDNPSSVIGSGVPGPNNTSEVVALAPEVRARAQSTFDQMAESIAAYEASPQVSPFSSKFDPSWRERSS
jgi:hypothetical protein